MPMRAHVASPEQAKASPEAPGALAASANRPRPARTRARRAPWAVRQVRPRAPKTAQAPARPRPSPPAQWWLNRARARAVRQVRPSAPKRPRPRLARPPARTHARTHARARGGLCPVVAQPPPHSWPDGLALVPLRALGASAMQAKGTSEAPGALAASANRPRPARTRARRAPCAVRQVRPRAPKTALAPSASPPAQWWLNRARARAVRQVRPSAPMRPRPRLARPPARTHARARARAVGCALS